MKNPYKARSPQGLHAGLNSREAILAAALSAFAQGGFDGASLPKIAKMANVATPLIHYYFGSKENLWRDTVDHSLGGLRREATAIRNATRALAPLDRLRALLQTMTQHAARLPDHFVMLIAEARSESDRFSWAQDNYTKVIFQEILSILEDARKEGAIQDVNLEQLAFILVGGVLLYFTVNPDIVNVEEDTDRLSDEFTDMMFRVILNGVATD